MDTDKLAQYEQEAKHTPFEIEATIQEKDFLKHYQKLGNAKQAVLLAYPGKYTEQSASRVGTKLVRKFNAHTLLPKHKKNNPEVKSTLRKLRQVDMVGYAKKQLEMGVIGEEECWDIVRTLMRTSIDDRTRFVAAKEMREWIKEAKVEIEGQNLSQLEVTKLLVNSISVLPITLYKEVLKEVRARRREIIKERGKKLTNTDIDKIIKEEREQMQRGRTDS